MDDMSLSNQIILSSFSYYFQNKTTTLLHLLCRKNIFHKYISEHPRITKKIQDLLDLL